MKDIKKALQYMRDIAKDDSHGYSQVNRSGDPDFDCSSLIAKALIIGGFEINPDSTTRDLYKQLLKNGFIECSSPWKPGDIHLSVGHHVVMSVDENTIVHASIDENGGIKGKKPGDQTGKEICERSYYEHKHGWTYHLRYVDKKEKVSRETRELSTKPMATVKCIASALNVRTWAGTEYPKLKKIPQIFKGDEVQICDIVADSNSYPWFYIKIPSKKYGVVYGFVHSDYLK